MDMLLNHVYQNLYITSAGLLCVQMMPTLYCCTDWHWIWQLPLNLIKSLSAHFSSLLRPFWEILLPFSVPIFLPSSVSSVNSLRMHSILSLRSLIKSLNSMSASLHPWGKPLIADYQLEFISTNPPSPVVQPILYLCYHLSSFAVRMLWVPSLSWLAL